MPTIKLNHDQLEILAESRGQAVLTDEEGEIVGYVSPIFSDEELAEAKRLAESDGPWYTTAEVLAHLKSLETP